MSIEAGKAGLFSKFIAISESYNTVKKNEEEVHNKLSSKFWIPSNDEIGEIEKNIMWLLEEQKRLKDGKLDRFKEGLFIFEGVVPSLGLFGLAGAAIIAGPMLALGFSAAFFFSNLYVKGVKSKLTLFFGISTALQVTAVTLGILVLLGVSAINPAIVPILCLCGGGYYLLPQWREEQKGKKKLKIFAYQK